MVLQAKDIVDIFTAITALLGILSTIYTFLAAHDGSKKNRPREATDLKFLRVERKPVEVKEWRRRKTLFLVSAIVCLTFIIVYGLILFYFFPPTSSDLGRVWAFIIIVLVGIINCLTFLYLYIELGEAPAYACSDLFQYVMVEVENDFDTIFVECQKALKNINAYALELAHSQRHLEAAIGVKLRAFGAMLLIQIEPGENGRHVIQVSIKQRFPLRILANGSWIMNDFLEQLLGK